MRFFNFKTSTTWLATWISVATMVMTPVAQGQEAKNISKVQMQGVLDQLGLNKQTTVGEFYQKNKDLFPERVRKEIEPVLMNYKNTMMPEFRIAMVKSSDGREIPNVTMNYNGQVINMQWFGEKNRFVKFQNTNLSEIDISNFTDMFSKVWAGDATIRKQAEANQTEMNKPQFTGLPVMNAVTWKKMTMQERVSYMVQIRYLYLDAQNVLIEKAKLEKNKSTRAGLEILEKIWAVFAGVEAEAADGSKSSKKKNLKPTKSSYAHTADVKALPKTTMGASCLVAGYTAAYNGVVCDHNKILDTYKNVDIVTKAQSYCGADKMACNPIIYGTPDNGNAICVSLKDPSFQVATHFGGPCDSKSLLQSSTDAVKILKDDDKNKKAGRYDDGNMLTEDQRRELFRNEQAKSGFSETQKFLEGILQATDPKLKDMFEKGVLNDDVLKVLKDTQASFDTEIKRSTDACRTAAADKNAKHEKNFYGACDQLHRRFLFVGDLLKSKCDAGTELNPDTLKCACPSKVEVAPGEKCTAAPVTPPVTEPPTTTHPTKPPTSPFEECPKGQHPAGSITSEVTGAKALNCVPDADPNKPKADECGILCSIWKGVKAVGPWVVGLGASYLIYKALIPKKVNLNPAGDVCPNGMIAPCGQACPGNMGYTTAGCACTACPPGQTSSGAPACTCSTATTTTTGSTYTCWDGVTKVTDLTLCPAQTITCWDGSKVTNPLNCPEKTTTTTTGKTTTPTTGTGR